MINRNNSKKMKYNKNKLNSLMILKLIFKKNNKHNKEMNNKIIKIIRNNKINKEIKAKIMITMIMMTNKNKYLNKNN